MRSIGDIAAFVLARADIMRLLAALARQDLPDAWIGAGAIRNAIWDALSGIDTRAPSDDVDAIYFDRTDTRAERDRLIEEALRRDCPDIPWSVKNQARMHERNGDRPYRDSADAIAHWPETATAIAVRAVGGQIEVLAPHGIDDLIGLVVRPSPAFAFKPEAFRQRLQEKNWQARWPRLRVAHPD